MRAEDGPESGEPGSAGNSAGAGTTVPVYAGAHGGLQGTKSEMASVEHLVVSAQPAGGAGRPKQARSGSTGGTGGPGDGGGDQRGSYGLCGPGPLLGTVSSGNPAADAQQRQLEAALVAEKAKVAPAPLPPLIAKLSTTVFLAEDFTEKP